jgi:hypothetical protein
MSSSYASNKQSIYNWRNKNRDKWNEYRRVQTKNRRIWIKISFEFMNILL